MEVVNTGFFFLGCVQRVDTASDFHITDVVSDFASDHLYFPKHFTYNKYDCHTLMVRFKTISYCPLQVLEICVFWSIFPGRIFRNESGQKFLSSNARLLKEAQSSYKDICWADINGQ